VLLLLETLVGLVVTKATNEELHIHMARLLRALHWAVRSREAPSPNAVALALQAGQILQHRFSAPPQGRRQAIEEAQEQVQSDVAAQIAETSDLLQFDLLKRPVDWQATQMVSLLELIIAVASIRGSASLDDETGNWRREQIRQILGPFCKVVFPKHPDSPEVFTDRQVGMLAGFMADTRGSHRGKKLQPKAIENNLRVADECLAIPEAKAE